MNIIAKNEGKRFEDAFVKSIPDYVLVKRLNDNASSWSGGTNTRFASKNECDYILFNDHTKTFYGLEMKSTKHSSLTFWRKDFEDEYLSDIKHISLIMSENYIKEHFGEIKGFENVIEKRLCDDLTIDELIRDN